MQKTNVSISHKIFTIHTIIRPIYFWPYLKQIRGTIYEIIRTKHRKMWYREAILFFVCAVCRSMAPSKTLQMETRHKSWEPFAIRIWVCFENSEEKYFVRMMMIWLFACYLSFKVLVIFKIFLLFIRQGYVFYPVIYFSIIWNTKNILME